MRYLFAVIIALMLCSPQLVFAGSPVSDAKAKIEKEHHEGLVAKAQKLLERKAKVEAELDSLRDRLKDLDNGKDVSDVVPNECNGFIAFR